MHFKEHALGGHADKRLKRADSGVHFKEDPERTLWSEWDDQGTHTKLREAMSEILRTFKAVAGRRNHHVKIGQSMRGHVVDMQQKRSIPGPGSEVKSPVVSATKSSICVQQWK